MLAAYLAEQTPQDFAVFPKDRASPTSLCLRVQLPSPTNLQPLAHASAGIVMVLLVEIVAYNETKHANVKSLELL
jgi:hypothetical protein